MDLTSQSIWVKLERYPPVLVRLLATAPWARQTLMNDQMIQRRSGGQLTLGDVKQLSYAPSWDNIPVAKMRAFCVACNVDFASPARMKSLNRYLKNSPAWLHLRRDPNFESYQQMLNEYYNYEARRSSH